MLTLLFPFVLVRQVDAYAMRVNVAERQEFDYDLSLPGTVKPYRLLYTVVKVAKKGDHKVVLWNVQQFERDAKGVPLDRPSLSTAYELDDRNNPIKGSPTKTVVDAVAFGASEQSRQVGRLVLRTLNPKLPITGVYPGRTYDATLDNPLVKTGTYRVDYKVGERLVVHSWDCYRIEFATSLSAGYGGREMGIDGVAVVERSTGMPVTVDLRVTGADAVSESLNRTFRVHLTRDREEK